MNQVDLALPQPGTGAAIRNRRMSPLELVELYLERIQRLDAQLGSYFSVDSSAHRCNSEDSSWLKLETPQIATFLVCRFQLKTLTVAGVP